MQVIAKVVSFEITQSDIDRECLCVPHGSTSNALKRLIDRCLLLAKATQMGYSVSDEEFDIALLEILEEEEPFGLPAGSLQDMDAAEMETLLKRNILIRKYINSLFLNEEPITESKMHELYQEQVEHFCCEEMVRCSHILVKGSDKQALAKILEIKNNIQSIDDFNRISSSCSDCPTNAACGDLGYFPRGMMIPEIEEVAFSMVQNEVSEPFLSEHGYHILMLTDRKCKSPIPYGDIKDSLASQARQMEREYSLMRHLSELYHEFQSQIVILNDAFKQA